jgi:hypothetical protein
MALFSVLTLVLLGNGAAFGQPAVARRTTSLAVAAPAAPTITIFTAGTGAMVRSQGVNTASLNLGLASYFNGTSAQGETSQKEPGALVISTTFALRIDCPGSSGSSQVNVTVSRLDADSSHDITIDGIKLGSAPQPLLQSMPCGSSGEHRLDVEVPISTPARSIESTVAFVATLNR